MRRGELASGRAVAYMMMQRFKLDFGVAMVCEISTLMAWEYRNDLEIYLDGLDQLLMGMRSEPDEHWLFALVEPQLRKCPELVATFERLDSAPEDSPEKTLKFLYSSACARVERKRKEAARISMLKHPKVTVAKVAEKATNGG